MKLVSINMLPNRMMEILIARRFLLFFWKYTWYESIDVKIPFEEWIWFNETKDYPVMKPAEAWMLDEYARGDRLS